MNLDRWIGSKPRENKEVSHDDLETEFRKNLISYQVT